MIDHKQVSNDWVKRQIATRGEEYRNRVREIARNYYYRHHDKVRAKDNVRKEKYRLENKDKYNAEQRKYRKEHPEKFKKYYEERTEWRKAYTKRKTIEKYGITQEQHKQMLLKQEGKCALCEKTFTGQINIDHDHVTGKVRGLLCSHCNTSLGYIEKCIIMQSNILDRITKYLAINSKQIEEALKD